MLCQGLQIHFDHRAVGKAAALFQSAWEQVCGLAFVGFEVGANPYARTAADAQAPVDDIVPQFV
jgi:hypothetical protein